MTGVCGIDVEYADHPSLEFTFDTPKGSLKLSSVGPKGIVFPRYNSNLIAAIPRSELSFTSWN
jgi:hypothetical protein